MTDGPTSVTSQLCARRLAPAAVSERLPLRRLRALPDRQSRLARGQRLRRWAEKRCAPARMPVTVIGFFAIEQAETGNGLPGWPRLLRRPASRPRPHRPRDAWASGRSVGHRRAGPHRRALLVRACRRRPRPPRRRLAVRQERRRTPSAPAADLRRPPCRLRRARSRCRPARPTPMPTTGR